MNLINWCADECERQQSGEKSVARMVEAFLYCNKDDNDVRETWVRLVQRLGEIVEPEKNVFGFRRQPVTIHGEVIPVFDFYEKMERLCGYAAVYQITPEEWYQEFQTLHPFNDGNGRVGAIMYNYLLGSSQDKLLVPPKYQKPGAFVSDSPMPRNLDLILDISTDF